MVSPLLPIGIGAQIAGGIISRADGINNANAVADARNSVLMDYLRKQNKLSDEGRGYIDNTVAGYAPETQGALLTNMQAARSKAGTDAMGPMSDPNDVTVSGSAPPAVRSEIAKRMLTQFGRATDHAKAVGNLGGYGDQWQENNLGITDTARRIGTVNNFARGNAGILTSQQDLAEIAARKQPSIWGKVLSAGGQMATLAGANGWSPFGGAAASPGLEGGLLWQDAPVQSTAAFPPPSKY